MAIMRPTSRVLPAGQTTGLNDQFRAYMIRMWGADCRVWSNWTRDQKAIAVQRFYQQYDPENAPLEDSTVDAWIRFTDSQCTPTQVPVRRSGTGVAAPVEPQPSWSDSDISNSFFTFGVNCDVWQHMNRVRKIAMAERMLSFSGVGTVVASQRRDQLVSAIDAYCLRQAVRSEHRPVSQSLPSLSPFDPSIPQMDFQIPVPSQPLPRISVPFASNVHPVHQPVPISFAGKK